MEDFSKQKIVYQELTQGSNFYFDENAEFFVSNTGYLITGKDLDYLIMFLNSKIVEFAFRKFYSTSLGQNGVRWLSQYIQNLPITLKKDDDFKNLISEEEKENFIKESYQLSDNEFDFITKKEA